jgi:hypothetical protein
MAKLLLFRLSTQRDNPFPERAASAAKTSLLLVTERLSVVLLFLLTLLTRRKAQGNLLANRLQLNPHPDGHPWAGKTLIYIN